MMAENRERPAPIDPFLLNANLPRLVEEARDKLPESKQAELSELAWRENREGVFELLSWDETGVRCRYGDIEFHFSLEDLNRPLDTSVVAQN